MLKKMLLTGLVASSLFAEVKLEGAFEYKLGEELDISKLERVSIGGSFGFDCYKFNHKPIGKLVNFEVCAGVYNGHKIQRIIATSLLYNYNSSCKKDLQPLIIAIKDKYGKYANKWGSVELNNRELDIKCKSNIEFINGRMKSNGYYIEYYLNDKKLFKQSKQLAKEYEAKKAKQKSSQYSGQL